MRKKRADLIITNIEVGEFGADTHCVPGKEEDLVPRQAQSSETVTKPSEAVLPDVADVVVGEVEIAQILQLVECS